ncbi:MAG TPA: cyclic nucleotide-binding domain-containing protein [Actinomycetota bacterium]|jgi:CRP-like cAMP-binding protein
MTNVTSLIAQVPIFADCSPKDLAAVVRGLKEVNHQAGTVIAREGDPGIGLFVIAEGTAKVSVGGKTKAKLGPGDFFGEIALLDGGPRTATVTAQSDVRLYGLTEWAFRGLLQEHPAVAVKTLQSMAGRLRQVTKAATA